MQSPDKSNSPTKPQKTSIDLEKFQKEHLTDADTTSTRSTNKKYRLKGGDPNDDTPSHERVLFEQAFPGTKNGWVCWNYKKKILECKRKYHKTLKKITENLMRYK